MTSRTTQLLVPSEASLVAAALELLYQATRMFGGIGKVVLQLFSNFELVSSSGYSGATNKSKWAIKVSERDDEGGEP